MITLEQKIWDLERKIQNLEARLMHMIMPVSQTETTNEQTLASAQFSFAGGTASDTQLLQTYGFWSRPLEGSTHILANFGGVSGNGVSIGSSDERYRPMSMAPGDCVMGDNQGQSVSLSAGNINMNTGGTITVNGSGGITITAPTLTINADVVITGTLTDNGHDVGSTHKHTNTQTGSGLSGVPQ